MTGTHELKWHRAIQWYLGHVLCPCSTFMSLTSDDVKLLNHLLPVGKLSLHLILEIIWGVQGKHRLYTAAPTFVSQLYWIRFFFVVNMFLTFLITDNVLFWWRCRPSSPALMSTIAMNAIQDILNQDTLTSVGRYSHAVRIHQKI